MKWDRIAKGHYYSPIVFLTLRAAKEAAERKSQWSPFNV